MTKPTTYPLGTKYGVKGDHWAAGRHTGADYLTPKGSPIKAALGGRVIHAGRGGWGQAYGVHVIIEGRWRRRNVRVAYCHLEATKVKVGQVIKPGDLVGAAGNTGNVTGYHLHLEARRAPYGYGDDFDPAELVGARAWVKPRATKGAENRFLHLKPYALNNSFEGLRKGRAKGHIRADRDFHVTRDGVMANVHDGNLREHPVGRDLVGGHITKTPWAKIKRARTRDGRRIHTMAADLNKAAKLGYKTIEAEPKGVPTVAQFARLKARADRLGIELIVKRLTNLPGSVNCLANAKAAGITTMVLPRGSRRLARADYWPVTDLVRGPVIWTGTPAPN